MFEELARERVPGQPRYGFARRGLVIKRHLSSSSSEIRCEKLVRLVDEGMESNAQQAHVRLLGLISTKVAKAAETSVTAMESCELPI